MSALTKELAQVSASYRFLAEFREQLIALLTKQFVANLHNKQVNDFELQKIRSKAGKRFTTWFYDNLAAGNIEWRQLPAGSNIPAGPVLANTPPLYSLIIREFRTGYIEQDLPPVEVKGILRGIEPKRTVTATIESETSLSPAQLAQENAAVQQALFSAGNTMTPRVQTPDRVVISGPGLTVNVPINIYRAFAYQYRGTLPSAVAGYGTAGSQVEYQELAARFHADLFTVLGLYAVLNIDTNYLAVPANVVQTFFQMELFGSSANVSLPYYFSPFPHIEQRFGSLGNFFHSALPLQFSRFLFNPPYTEAIIERAALQLIEELQTRTSPATVFVTIPVWDPKSQESLGQRNNNRPFVGYDYLIASGLVREAKVWPQRVKFFDSVTLQLIPTIPIHALILSNGQPEFTIAQIEQIWPN